MSPKKLELQWIFFFSASCSMLITSAVNVTPNPQYSFEQCLVSKPSLGYCFGITALNKLQSFDNDPAFDVVDGVTFVRDDQRPRALSNFLERDPGDFSGILDTMNYVMSYRTLRWDMNTLYPGLFMRVTPSVDGVLEFVMDPRQEDLTLKSHGQYKEIGTARILARQFLVPFLLGIKFKVATIIPIIFGLLALMAKKALFLSKAALVLSSSLALGSLLFGTNNYASPSYHGPQIFGSHGHHHQVHPSWHPHVAYKNDESLGELSDILYKGFMNKAEDDQLKFSHNLPLKFERENNEGRNFAWNDSNEGMKT